MSEKLPTFEVAPSLEKSIIQSIHEKGAKHPDVRDLLQVWNEQEILKLPNTPEAQVDFDLRLGRMYLSAGLFDEAYDMFMAAAGKAEKDGEIELCGKIEKEMAEIDEMIVSLKPELKNDPS